MKVTTEHSLDDYDKEEADINPLHRQPLPPYQDKKKVADYFCCICCPCLPMWMRWSCCFIFIVAVTLMVVLGVLAALFKVPTIEFNGATDDPTGLPRFQKDQDSLAFTFNLGLKIGVVNPNLESAYFESIKAVAFYPTSPRQAVGGGEIKDLNIRAYATTNFTFPVQVKYDPAHDGDQAMLLDISSKCGLLGGEKRDLSIIYDLTPRIRVFGFAFAITIRQNANFPCPISDGQIFTPSK
ncbi:uncharacterized protein BYT42DRAFT_570676 [Radiomyces spectabilis]|uniref:uncharacterized protein n=1 Tax=Radiomyces spectabilis TaxID=64574 RepID=UPI00221F51C8|nr:uncharacterized protein BYT42DRAFT_570676 [Radiomyces spectabilis]KAI8377549.1 hypothetical protein BYT42DRAFT_570676 [Radiomyces spectabilis]